MSFFTRLLGAIPILPAVGGIFRNRRNTASKVCAPADLSLNVSDWFFSWVNRVPRKASMMRDRHGRHVGVIHRKP